MKLVIVALLLSGCAAVQLAPPDQRRVEYVQTTKAKKKDAYNRALAHLGKVIGDSNRSIKVQSPDEGVIVAKVNVICNVFRQSMDPNDYFLSADFEFAAKDNRVKFLFEDLRIVTNLGVPFDYAYNQITDGQQTEKASPCLRTISDGILASIAKGVNQKGW